MIEIKNNELRIIEKKVRSEEFSTKENSYHTTLLLRAIEECDNRLFDQNDADITIQCIFDEDELCNGNETLQDVLSDNIYSYLEDIRNACNS